MLWQPEPHTLAVPPPHPALHMAQARGAEEGVGPQKPRLPGCQVKHASWWI